MKNSIIIGGQWGDEGKGKLVDVLTQEMDGVIRFQGGNNAGHTLKVKNQKFVVHILPSGAISENKICCLGNGVVIDPFQLVKEIDHIEAQGFSLRNRLFISSRAHIIFPCHIYLDNHKEQIAQNKIGTTGRGIGPTYEAKVARLGIRVSDLFFDKICEARVEEFLRNHNDVFKNDSDFDKESILKYCEYFRNVLKPFACDISLQLKKWEKKHKSLVFEGAQGTLLDIDFGTYPYVTSSSPTTGGALTGTGATIQSIAKIILVFKSYVTRVGEGPFPTEDTSIIGKKLQKFGHEFGATTGRPRRCGWFDLVLAKHAIRINGATEIFLTKLDVLSILSEIKVCSAYRYNGEIYEELPWTEDFEQFEPIYETLPGWNKDISDCRNFEELPPEAKNYIKFLENHLEVKITLISVGAERNEVIRINP